MLPEETIAPLAKAHLEAFSQKTVSTACEEAMLHYQPGQQARRHKGASSWADGSPDLPTVYSDNKRFNGA